MFHDFDATEHVKPRDHPASGTTGELLSEIGLSGRAIREILPDNPPAGARFDIEEFE